MSSYFTPPAASTAATSTDAIYLALVLVSGLIVLLVAGLIVGFSARFRNGSRAPRRELPELVSRQIEIGWTVATLLAFLFFFAWAAVQDFSLLRDTPGALTIQILGKQWMWKAEHPGGQREINALHVPVGTSVRLVLNSQDVIHSFYVPALRLKHDVVPGLTRYLAFTATQPGSYPIECAEFCGTSHARMTGTLTVMSKDEYAQWLSAQPQGDTLASLGAERFRELGCSGCHFGRGAVRAPSLVGVFGNPVPLSDGRVVTADEAYIRDSILQPRKDIVAGYEPRMPSFAGRVAESDVIALVAYIRSLGTSSAAAQAISR